MVVERRCYRWKCRKGNECWRCRGGWGTSSCMFPVLETALAHNFCNTNTIRPEEQKQRARQQEEPRRQTRIMLHNGCEIGWVMWDKIGIGSAPLERDWDRNINE